MIIPIMQMNSQSQWASRSVTFFVAALAAAGGVYWVLKWPVTTIPATASTLVIGVSHEPQALARLLGGEDVLASSTVATARTPSRMILTGVVASTSQGGTALIAIDGKPAKPYRVGSQVDEGLMLQSVAKRRAVLAVSANGPVSTTLEMISLSK